jgi:SpoVK/Ycf46/Vps4 family AAA+-type ATPase
MVTKELPVPPESSILPPRKSVQRSRKAVLVEKLESSSQPYIFKFLGITDGSKALRIHKEYRGNLVGLMHRALAEWFVSPDVKHLEHPQGFSCQSRRPLLNGQLAVSTGTYFLEINGVRVALLLYVRAGCFQEMNIAFEVRKIDAPKLKAIFSDIESAASRLTNIVLDGEGTFEPNLSSVAWSDIILSEEIRRIIETNTLDLMAKAELFRRQGVPLKRGLLFWGAPGCGKTLCAKALMSQFPRSIYVTCSDLNKYADWGIPEIYGLARRLAPCLVVLEDLDVLGVVDRNNNPSRILGQLLAELDGLETNQGIVTVATTNEIATLDVALKNLLTAVQKCTVSAGIRCTV